MLSKSKIIAFRQCPKRLWLSKHRPELSETSAASETAFTIGHTVGDIARQLFGTGELIYDSATGTLSDAIVRSAIASRAQSGVLYEAAFRADDTLVVADVVQLSSNGSTVIEVKSSASVKDYQVEDAATQTYVMRQAGIRVGGVCIAHIDTSFVYPGGEDYRGLLRAVDVTEKVEALTDTVPKWIHDAKRTLLGPEPDIAPGRQCKRPFACPFYDHCNVETVEYPIENVPKLKIGNVRDLLKAGITDARDIPDSMVDSPELARFHRAVVTGSAEVDVDATLPLKELPFPRYYLDFETISFAVPIWPGTRPYQALPFQWSLHTETSDRDLTNHGFLDLSGECPARDCMKQLVEAVGDFGPIIVYTNYERSVIQAMMQMYPELAPALALAKIVDRLFDLHPVTKAAYYHRDMQGSWSIKAVLPTLAPDLRYDALVGVQNGMQAQTAYLEAIHTNTQKVRRDQIRDELITYCKLDTLAMVAITRALCNEPIPSFC